MIAQHYLDALRKGEYFKALKLVDYVSRKYQEITGELIGGEELPSLLGYELSLTDINENDLSAFTFLYNYIDFNNAIATGQYAYASVALLTQANQIVAIKQDVTFKSVLSTVKIENKTQLKSFVNPNSPFSQLIQKIMNPPGDWYGEMVKKPNPEALFKIISSMDEAVFFNFYKETEQIKEELEKEKILFSCSFVQNRIETNELKNMINNYQIHLSNKCKNESFSIDDEGLFLLPEDPSPNQVKLYQRYSIITLLNKEIQQRTTLDESIKSQISEDLEFCKKTGANWTDRILLQKITDILSIGLKPVFRSFFSKESAYKAEITELLYSSPLVSAPLS